MTLEEWDMGYDRYDTRQGSRGEQSRWSEDQRPGRGNSGERSFFERAGEEIASWFGDDDRFDGRDRERPYVDRDHRQERGERSGFEGRERDDERARYARRDHDEDRNWFGGRGPGEQRNRNRFEERSREMSSGGSWRGSEDRGDRGYRPITGDYGRSEGLAGRGRPQTDWDQDDYRRTSFAGSRERSQHHDPQYQQWRERQLQELDRDYHDYHRERQTRFEDDFGGWRQQRQQKRQMLGQVREHMEVVGTDGEHVGTVDKVAQDRIILTRSDPAAGGAHHSISCSNVDRIEGDRVLLDCTAEQAKQRWRDEDRSRALFERDGRERDNGREAGPHMLDRSFSGTYRD